MAELGFKVQSASGFSPLDDWIVPDNIINNL